jgi:hypothetical protein
VTARHAEDLAETPPQVRPAAIVIGANEDWP